MGHLVEWLDDEGNIYIAVDDYPAFSMAIPAGQGYPSDGGVVLALDKVEIDGRQYFEAQPRFLIRWDDDSATFILDNQQLRTDFSALHFLGVDYIFGSFKLMLITPADHQSPYLLEFDTGRTIPLIEPGTADIQLGVNFQLNYSLALMSGGAELDIDKRYRYIVFPANFYYPGRVV